MFFPLQATRVRILLFALLLLVDNVSLESISVVGVVGATVVLPCQIQIQPRRVYWRHKDTENVCDIAGAEADFQEQDSAYKGRVSVFRSEIKSGNFSIRLDKVSKSDEGLYSCSAPDVRHKWNLQLTVKENKEEELGDKSKSRIEVTTTMSAPSSGQSARRADGLFTLLLGSALLYSATF